MTTRMRFASTFTAILVAATLSTACKPGSSSGSTMKMGESSGSATAEPGMGNMAAGQPDTRAPTDRDPKLSVQLPPCSPGATDREAAQPPTPDHGAANPSGGADVGMAGMKPDDMKETGRKIRRWVRR